MNKIKLLLIPILVVVFILGFSVAFAALDDSQGKNLGQNQNQNQNQEQGIENVENPEATEAGNEDESDEELPGRNNQINAELHRSAVSNFVQSLLKVAEKENSAIGVQVRVIAQEQNQNKERIADRIEAIEKRNKFKTFLIGTDYKSIGALRSDMVRVRNRLEQLNKLMVQVKNETDKTELQTQIQIMEEEQAKIETFLKQAEGKFSLLGWLVKSFVKTKVEE